MPANPNEVPATAPSHGLRYHLVEKRGRCNPSNWSGRILTFDDDHRAVYLSKKGDPNTLTRHKVSICQVVGLRVVDPKKEEDLFSDGSTRTLLRISGYKMPPSARDKERAFSAAEATPEMFKGEPAVTWNEMERRKKWEMVTLLLVPGARTSGKRVDWVIRTGSNSSLHELVQSFFKHAPFVREGVTENGYTT